MLAARLRRSADIAKVRASGRSLRGVGFAARALPNDGADVRIAVTAPKMLGRAVARNRMRRRVREAFRLALRSARIDHGVDIVVVARPEAATAEFRDLQEDAASALREAAR